MKQIPVFSLLFSGLSFPSCPEKKEYIISQYLRLVSQSNILIFHSVYDLSRLKNQINHFGIS